MKHEHVLFFAFSLQPLQAYLFLQQDYPQVSQDRHTSRVFFSPFFVRWPERVKPRQRLWGSAELLSVCPCIEDFSFCVPQGHSACPYRLCWTFSSAQLLTVTSAVLIKAFRWMLLYLYLYLTAEFRLQLQCENLLCLRWCWKFVLMESLLPK